MRKKVFVSLLVIATFIFSSFITAFAEDSEIYHGNVKFKNMEYEHYSLDEINKLASEFRESIKQSNNSEEVCDYIYDMMYEIDYIQSLYAYLDVQLSIDYTNTYYQEEKEYVSALYDDAVDVMGLAISDGLKSQYKQDLLNMEYFDLSYYEGYTALGNERNSQLVKYQTQYFQLYSDCLNNENMTAKEIEEFENSVADIYMNILDCYKGTYTDFDEYYEYYWGRDFSGEDVDKLYQYVKKYVVPIYIEMYNTYGDAKFSLYTKNMNEAYILDSIGMYIGRISSDMEEAFQYMRNLGLYYMGNSSNNVNEGYTTEFYHINEPFIYYYTENNAWDLKGMIHEFGHFYHAYTDDNYCANSFSDIEASEVHSQALELLFLDYYDEIFGDNADELRRSLLYDILGSVIEGCCIDEFERTVYNSNKKMTADEMTALLDEIRKEYGLDKTNSLIGDDWAYIPHLYQSPGYYISYAVSALIALDIWENSLTNREDAIQQYLDFEYYSDYRYLQDIIEHIGLEDIFSEQYVSKLDDLILNYVSSPSSNDTYVSPNNTTVEDNNSVNVLNTNVIIFFTIFIVGIVIIVIVGLVVINQRNRTNNNYRNY